MVTENSELDRIIHSMYILAMVNVGIWAISIIAIIFMMQASPIVKRLLPTLIGGFGVGGALIATISRLM